MDILFLKNCQNFNVIPKFLLFNIPHCNHYEERLIRKRLLRSAVHKREKERKQLVKDLNLQVTKIENIVSSFDSYLLTRAIKKNVQRYVTDIVRTHEKKLQQLTKNTFVPFKPDEVIKNMSTYSLSEDEKDILSNGLNFALPPRHIYKSDIFVTFEMINGFLTTNLKDEKDKNEIRVTFPSREHLRKWLQTNTKHFEETWNFEKTQREQGHCNYETR